MACEGIECNQGRRPCDCGGLNTANSDGTSRDADCPETRASRLGGVLLGIVLAVVAVVTVTVVLNFARVM